MSKQFYLRNVFFSSCFGFYINETLNSDVREFKEILNRILYNKTATEHVFSARV